MVRTLGRCRSGQIAKLVKLHNQMKAQQVNSGLRSYQRTVLENMRKRIDADTDAALLGTTDGTRTP